LKPDGKQAKVNDLLNNSDKNGEISARISLTNHVGTGSS